MKVNTINLIPISGGKDSQATLQLAVDRDTENIRGVFADTGIEHELTYRHLETIESEFGITINRLKADFTQRLAQKRMYVEFIWKSEGVPNTVCDAALAVLHPTGVPFLDLCLLKGRFPGHAKAEFCTFELKQYPMQDLQDYLLRNVSKNLIVWQGTRKDESARRAHLTEWDVEFGDVESRTGHLIYRQIVDWCSDDVFGFLKRSGKTINPLYAMGFNRVGCMPCKNERKNGVRIIAERFPEYVEKIEEFERLVSIANKHGVSTFFDARIASNFLNNDVIATDTHGIKTHVEWSRSQKTGRNWQFTMALDQEPECSSTAGYCE